MMHLVLDAICESEYLSNPDLVEMFLTRLPPAIGMQTLGDPVVVISEVEPVGITGFQVISKSHVTIHTFPEESHCYLDVFSCQNFEVKTVVGMFSEAFKVLTLPDSTMIMECRLVPRMPFGGNNG